MKARNMMVIISLPHSFPTIFIHATSFVRYNLRQLQCSAVQSGRPEAYSTAVVAHVFLK
jgi:hypothetical protein